MCVTFDKDYIRVPLDQVNMHHSVGRLCLSLDQKDLGMGTYEIKKDTFYMMESSLDWKFSPELVCKHFDMVRGRPFMIWGEEKLKMNLFFPREYLLTFIFPEEALLKSW